MEDPEEEWGLELEEYYPCSSGEDECGSKVSWIWNRGLKLGKKVAITGFVISSAPIILPPLVFVSALGFAVSVPFGVVFASYACTEKLMSKLLPIPDPPPLWEYESLLMDETDEESEFAGEILMEKKAKKQMEGEKLYEGESFKDRGYEEDVGEYMEGEDEGPLGGLDMKTEGSVEEVDKKPLIEESMNEKPLPEVKRVIVNVVGEEKKKGDVLTKPDELVVVSRVVKSDEGTTGLVEKIRVDEGNIAVESVKKNKKKNKHHSKKSHGIVGKKEDKHEKNVNEKKSTKEADEDAVTKNVVPDDRSSVMVPSKPAGNQGTATNGNHAPANSKTMEAEVKSGEGIQKSGVKSTALDGNDGKSTSSESERRETDESRMGDENVDFGDISMQAGPPKINHGGISEVDAAAVTSNKMNPSEEEEKKIWDQINALEVIVGYKAVAGGCHKTLMEALKALYIFTGVEPEPPSSFDKSTTTTDLRDAQDKLHFLMSIVGVK